MIDNKKFSIACTEVLEILKNIDEIEYNKIDKEFILVLEENKDKEYNFVCDTSIDFEDLEITPETNDILGYIYRKYWANEEEKKEFDQLVLGNKNEEIEKTLIKYEKKKNIFKKIFEWIKKCFKS